MQVIKENLKRPSLIEPFFNEELTPDNEFISYIDCSNHTTDVKNISVTLDAHNIEKLLVKKFLRDYSGGFYIFLVDTEKETLRFHSETQAVKYCIENEFFGDIQVFYKYEWADYDNDIKDDIPESIDIFNVQDSIHFDWMFADFERNKSPQPLND